MFFRSLRSSRLCERLLALQDREDPVFYDGVDLLGREGVSRILHKEVFGSRKDHKHKKQAGEIPLPGTAFIRPKEHAVKKTPKGSHPFLLFLMISEKNLMTAGVVKTANRIRMYFAGSSLPT